MFIINMNCTTAETNSVIQRGLCCTPKVCLQQTPIANLDVSLLREPPSEETMKVTLSED